VEMLRKAIERDPTFGQAHAALSEAYAMLTIVEPEQKHNALAAARRALELCPDSAEAHAACGFASGMNGDLETAEREYAQAVRINPDLYEAYYFWGRTEMGRGSHTRAIEMFEKAAEVDPREYQSLCLASSLYLGLGQIPAAESVAARALRRLQRHLELNPDDARALYLGAGVLRTLGRTDEGREWATRATEVDSTDAGSHYNVACFFAMLGEADRAIEHLTHAIDNGFAMVEWIANDPDFAGIRELDAFQAQLARLR